MSKTRLEWATWESGLAWKDMVRILKARGIAQDREVYDAIRKAMDAREKVLREKILDSVKEIF